MKNFYSATTKGFYHIDVHGSNMPADVVAVSDADYDHLINGQHVKEIKPDENGYPTLADVAPRVYTWQEQRQRAYPSIPDQLDLIFHQGLDAWKTKIQEVKDSIPKV